MEMLKEILRVVRRGIQRDDEENFNYIILLPTVGCEADDGFYEDKSFSFKTRAQSICLPASISSFRFICFSSLNSMHVTTIFLYFYIFHDDHMFDFRSIYFLHLYKCLYFTIITR